jgi:aryl-alcohol dehydrogenase-like predicted oxidoreductase
MIEKIPFGKTGQISTRTLFGAAAFAGVSQAVADETLDILLRYGVNHIDVAASYGDAELRVGPWMKTRRADFFLATKTEERGRAGAFKQIRRSLERLRTDRLDLLQFHAVTTFEELEKVTGPDGALDGAREAHSLGLVRFIGITSHGLDAPAILLKALERYEFASVLLPLNFPLMSNAAYAGGFRRLAAACRERGTALQTIKSICRRPWPEGAERFATAWYEPLREPEDIALAVRYVLGRPDVFLNTVSDVTLLPKVLAAAEGPVDLPADEEMRRLVDRRGMAPLWPAHEA